MVCGRYCEIDEHDRVARVLMSTPRTIPSQLLECGWNAVRISFDVEPNCFQDSGNDIVDISSHDISAGVCDSLVPLRDILRSKFFPVLLENSYTGFPLVDLFASAKCQCCLHCRVIFRQLRTLEFTSRFNRVNYLKKSRRGRERLPSPNAAPFSKRIHKEVNGAVHLSAHAEYL